MTLKGGTGKPCAACKHQRRRCTAECLLAPFFPAHEPKVFQNVNRLFGMKNIMKTLKEVGPDQRAMAVESIKFHANMRGQYPVHGCLVEIHKLMHQIQVAEEELNSVLHQLAYYREAARNYSAQLQLGAAPPPAEDYFFI